MDRVTAVSCGAVLAALNKNNGPARMAQSSYGIFRKELWQPTVPGFEAHRNCIAKTCSIDDQKYLYVVNYFVFKVS